MDLGETSKLQARLRRRSFFIELVIEGSVVIAQT
jgi:hypothetical protein